MQVRVATDDDAQLVAQLLYDFNTEYDEPTPPVAVLAARLQEMTDVAILLAGEVGVVVLRLHLSLWSQHQECYLAELYVRPDHRGQGIGESLLTAALRHARDLDADYIHLGTTEDDVAARHLYEKVGFRRTEGIGGPLMFVYEMDLA